MEQSEKQEEINHHWVRKISISAAKQKKVNELIKLLNSTSKQWSENQELYMSVQKALISYICKVETTQTRLKI